MINVKMREIYSNMQVLQDCNLQLGVAAERLGIPKSTLSMQKKKYYVKFCEEKVRINKQIRQQERLAEKAREKTVQEVMANPFAEIPAVQKKNELLEEVVRQKVLQYQPEIEFARIVTNVSLYRQAMGSSFILLMNRLNEYMNDKEKVDKLPFKDLIRGIEVLAPYLLEKKSPSTDEEENSDLNPHNRLMKTIYAQMNKKVEVIEPINDDANENS